MPPSRTCEIHVFTAWISETVHLASIQARMQTAIEKRERKRKTIKSRQSDKHGSLSRQGRNGGTKAGKATRWTKGEQRTGCKQTAAQIKLISVQMINTVEHKGEGGTGWRQRGGASKEKRLDRRNLVTVLWLIFFCLFFVFWGGHWRLQCACVDFLFLESELKWSQKWNFTIRIELSFIKSQPAKAWIPFAHLHTKKSGQQVGLNRDITHRHTQTHKDTHRHTQTHATKGI